MRSRVAHHLDFPDYSPDELEQIAELMLADGARICEMRELHAQRNIFVQRFHGGRAQAIIEVRKHEVGDLLQFIRVIVRKI